MQDIYNNTRILLFKEISKIANIPLKQKNNGELNIQEIVDAIEKLIKMINITLETNYINNEDDMPI